MAGKRATGSMAKARQFSGAEETFVCRALKLSEQLLIHRTPQAMRFRSNEKQSLMSEAKNKSGLCQIQQTNGQAIRPWLDMPHCTCPGSSRPCSLARLNKNHITQTCGC